MAGAFFVAVLIGAKVDAKVLALLANADDAGPPPSPSGSMVSLMSPLVGAM